ncbi:MAG: phosphatidylserine decarboxylase [Rhodocyclaceae bacterium]|nr:phosphatidylserine decarboxylase [Rhodocyclaceae bacterium]
MTMRAALHRFVRNEDINFLLTNRVPRIALTRCVGWLSHIESPLLTRVGMAVWGLFTPLERSESGIDHYSSLHQFFTRPLRPGARTIDGRPDRICSPSDGIVGASGALDGTTLVQAKGFPYRLDDLLGDSDLSARFSGGTYVTLRLTSAMYHRFHAPHDMDIDEVTYISGDTWNVNPIALKRVERLFCKNERAVLHARLKCNGDAFLLVPVAAVLVASIRLHFVDVLLHLRYRGPNRIPCAATVRKGEELGWFEHGSTIIVIAPEGYPLAEGISEGQVIKMGQALLKCRHT